MAYDTESIDMSILFQSADLQNTNANYNELQNIMQIPHFQLNHKASIPEIPRPTLSIFVLSFTDLKTCLFVLEIVPP